MNTTALDAAFAGVDLTGLSAAPVVSEGTPLELAHDAITPDPNQPRRVFDETALKELADSIKAQGVIQPIIVCQVSGKYQLIAGERRWRAAKLAGLATVPAIVREPMADYAQVIENEQRENLTALELAEFIGSKYQNGKGESMTAIAKKLGKSKAIISQYNSLNAAPEAVRTAMESGKLTSSRTANDLIKLYESHDPKQLDKQIKSLSAIGRGDVARISESLGSLSRQTPVKSASKKSSKAKIITQAVTEKQAESIRYARPIFRVALKRRIGVIVHDRDPNDPTRAWVLFKDKPLQIEQVNFRELTPHMFEPII